MTRGPLEASVGRVREAGRGLPDQVVLGAGDARVVVMPSRGGRVGSVRLGGLELLVNSSPEGLLYWGAYPMAPWAGRIRHGRFTFGGRAYELPLAMPPHAIHGVVWDRPWTVTGMAAATASLEIELDDRWPFRGRVEQRFELAERGLTVTMTLRAVDTMPATIGWHPWFRRVIGPSGSTPVRLGLDPGEMLVRDDEGIPTGLLAAPTPGPWDDAFTGLRSNPVLEWPGRIRLELSSTCDWWVVYTLPEQGVCVEPQSGPPDAVNLTPIVVEAGDTLERTMRWRWTDLGGDG